MIRNNSKKDKRGEQFDYKWFITIFITTFILSLFFSYISTVAISDISVVPAIILLVFIVFVGIFFDVIGIAVTVGIEENFHAMASKKQKGAKTAIKMIKNSARVANICADVIGDICGVLSGAISAVVTFKITSAFNIDFNIQFIISAFVASLTVGGKAIGKEIAQKYSTQIISFCAKIVSFTEKNK